MATWHQNKRPVKLYHDTQWTIVTDPPGGCRSLMTFSSEQSAHDTLALWNEHGRNPHSYILRPANQTV